MFLFYTSPWPCFVAALALSFYRTIAYTCSLLCRCPVLLGRASVIKLGSRNLHYRLLERLCSNDV